MKDQHCLYHTHESENNHANSELTLDGDQTDLTEVFKYVKNDQTRKLIEESIKALNVDLLGASIISIWNAINYDISRRLLVMANHGNNDLKTYFTQCRNARDERNYQVKQTLEQKLFDLALKNGIINVEQVGSLNQLRKDRNNCAHAFIIGNDRPFEPRKNNVRRHIKNVLNVCLKEDQLAAINSINSDARVDQVDKNQEEEGCFNFICKMFCCF